MAVKHRSIHDFHAYFVDKLEVNFLLSYLRDQKWLTIDEYETLQSGQMTRRLKVEKLLLLLPRKTTSSFPAEKIFMECTIWSNQCQLAKELGYSDDEIQEICSRNPSATTPVQDTPGHGNANQGGHMGCAQGYGQPQYTGAVGVQQGGATGYGGTNSRVAVGPSAIMYCKDDDPEDAIQFLAEILRGNGVDCDIDQYHSNEKISNWDQWWERKVRQIAEQNGFILFVCSPTLMRHLLNNERIQMKEGSISCQLLSSLIENRRTTSHLVPVFIDHYITEHVPMSLLQRRCYALKLSSLGDHFDLENENVTLSRIQSIPEFQHLVSLVYKLTGQPEVEMPPVQFPRIPRPVKASVPIQESLGQSVPNSSIDERDIPELVRLIGTRSWSKLAVRLKVPMKTISKIRDQYPNRPNEACREMLRTWLKDTKSPLTRQELEQMIARL